MEDPVPVNLVEGDPQERGHLGLPNRHPEVHYQFVSMRRVVRLMEGYAIRPLVPVITVVVRSTLLKIVPVLADLGHLPPLKDLFKVMPLEVHSQPAEAEVEAVAVLLAARA